MLSLFFFPSLSLKLNDPVKELFGFLTPGRMLNM